MIYRISLFVFAFFSILSLSAQPKKKSTSKKAPVKTTNTSKNPSFTPPPPTPKPSTKNNNNNNNKPIIVTGGDGAVGGFNDSVRQSLRPDNIIERNLVKDRAPLVYEHLREDDAVYKQRIWREIDTREKMNLPFRYALVENNGNQRFISILLSGLKRGDYIAFEALDDRFTIPLTKEQVFSKLGSRIDTVAQYDLDGNITGYVAKAKEIELDSVYKFRIKEEVVFDKESSRLFTRILGIAPMMPLTLADGTPLLVDGKPQFNTLFWIYYPDLRSTLARYEIFNPKNFGARMSWEDLFEGRMFSSYITKSSIDNPFDRSLKEKYGKNSLFALLESEAIKEKIFNYEQNLWAY